MPKKATKKLLATFNLKTFKTYQKLEETLNRNNIQFKKESGNYGGSGKIFYDYKRNAIVITSYLKRTYYNPIPNTANIIINGNIAPVYEVKWKYTHYIIDPTPENIEKLNKLLKININI